MLTIEMYNSLRGTKFAANAHNMDLINKLNALGVTEAEVKAYVLPAGKEHQHEMRQMVSDMKKWHKEPNTPAATPAAEPKKEVKMEKVKAAANSADALIEALNGVLRAPALDEEAIKAIVKKVAEEEANKAVEEKLKTVRAVKLEVVSPKGTHTVSGRTHKSFKEVLTYISAGTAVYIYGPAGTGKTHMARQIADALGLEFYYSGQLLQPYELTGFTDANGRYQETPFYNAFTKGGVILFDELDRSIAEAITKINGALANGYFDFPAPIGTVQAHPDFRVIAAGNTLGRGGNSLYTAANILDASTLDRFGAFIEVGYDKDIEDAIDKEAADFVRAMRKAAGLAGLDVILSYRAIQSLSRFSEILGAKKVIQNTITAPLSKDDINILKRSEDVKALAVAGNKYAVAFA